MRAAFIFASAVTAIPVPAQLKKAIEEFAWIKEHPDAFARFKSDRREKDDIAWYNADKTKLMGKWSPTLVSMYLAN